MSRNSTDRRAWQLPRGVSSGTWDYVAEPSIATEYDSFHGAHPLMQLDMQLVDNQLDQLLVSKDPESFVLADFGCGTGRVARHVGTRAIRTLNVDLSSHMLREVAAGLQGSSPPGVSSQQTARQSAQQNALVHSNLVELDWLADKSIDLAVCLFSSLGMIRGRANRVSFLSHVARTLKPDGVFLLHVHNRGHSWLDPKGPGWLMSTMMKRLFDRTWELGDRVYIYRGLPQMFLHIYSRRELESDLRGAGLPKFDIIPVNLTGSTLLRSGGFGEYFKAGGFFALCHAEG